MTGNLSWPSRLIIVSLIPTPASGTIFISFPLNPRLLGDFTLWPIPCRNTFMSTQLSASNSKWKPRGPVCRMNQPKNPILSTMTHPFRLSPVLASHFILLICRLGRELVLILLCPDSQGWLATLICPSTTTSGYSYVWSSFTQVLGGGVWESKWVCNKYLFNE